MENGIRVLWCANVARGIGILWCADVASRIDTLYGKWNKGRVVFVVAEE
jgi:hypothetical protein